MDPARTRPDATAPTPVAGPMPLDAIQALARADMAAVDALIRAPAGLRRGADQPGRRIHHRRRRQAPAADAAAARGARRRRQAARRGRRAAAGGGDRIHPHRDAAARRRRRRIRPAPRPPDRQRGVGQRGQRAGRRFPLFAQLPDDGRAGSHARDAHARRHHQPRSPKAKCCSCCTSAIRTPTKPPICA